MTASVLLSHYQIDVSPEGLERILNLSRRALRARDVSIMPPDHAAPDAAADHDSTLLASVTPEQVAVATLVAIDDQGRSWSEDDRAMLDDLAAILADEVRFRAEKQPPFSTSVARENAAADPEPPAQADPVVIETAPDAHGQEEDALRILLADDLDLNRKLICDMLSIDGYVCDSVADGAAAVEAVKCKTYDLVLMDMIMPGMDGMEATRAIRALPSPLCDVPIVALTAHSFREQLDNCLRAGMNATLTKPMSFDSLSAAVNTWARHRQAA